MKTIITGDKHQALLAAEGNAARKPIVLENRNGTLQAKICPTTFR
ncbi:MAG: hypothetical protein WC829_13345 [Hyphomicrobium sp.]|jgi:hypothetical protein